MECHLEHNNASTSYMLLHTTVTSNKEIPKKFNILRIKYLTRRDGQNKASMSSKFEGQPSISNNDSAFICTEEFVEGSSTSKDEEISEHAHDNIESINSKYKHICKICNESFESESALSGHKRIHSDKVVKKEVLNKAHNGSQVLSNLADNDLEWKSKGKKGQKRKCSNDNDDAMISAAKNLLYFSSIMHMEAESTHNGSTKAIELQVGGDDVNILETDQNTNRNSIDLNAALHGKTREIKVEGGDGIIVASTTKELQSCKDQITIWFKEVLESDLRLSVANADEIMEMAGTQNALGLANHGKENAGTSSNQEKEKSALGNDLTLGILNENSKRKRIKLESEPTDAQRVYVCQICNKSFSSHQALGGHAVSHYKGKPKQGDFGQTTKKSKMSEHKCKICSKVYETGQYLGGHMRKHYDPDKSKNLGIDLTLQIIKEDDSKGSDKSCSANDTEETEQLPIIDDDIIKYVSGESSSENVIEDTNETKKKKILVKMLVDNRCYKRYQPKYCSPCF